MTRWRTWPGFVLVEADQELDLEGFYLFYIHPLKTGSWLLWEPQGMTTTMMNFSIYSDMIICSWCLANISIKSLCLHHDRNE